VEWISILDKVPGNSRVVLVWLDPLDLSKIGREPDWGGPYIASYNPKKESSHDGWHLKGSCSNGQVTHWMDIIAPEDL
jgi:hypothetical protein